MNPRRSPRRRSRSAQRASQGEPRPRRSASYPQLNYPSWLPPPNTAPLPPPPNPPPANLIRSWHNVWPKNNAFKGPEAYEKARWGRHFKRMEKNPEAKEAMQQVDNFHDVARISSEHGYDIVNYLGGGAFGHAFLVQFNGGHFQGNVPKRQIVKGGREEKWNVPSALPLQAHKHTGGFRTHSNYHSMSPGQRAVLKVLHALDDVEINMMVRFKHPYITRVLDAFVIETPGPIPGFPHQRTALVMELGRHGALNHYRDQVNEWQAKQNVTRLIERISPEHAWCWVKQVALAVHYINHQRISHGDLHPGNTFVFDSDDNFGLKLKLGDFGNAFEFGFADPDTGLIMANGLRPNVDVIQEITQHSGNSQAEFQAFKARLMPFVSVRGLLGTDLNFSAQQIEDNKEGRVSYDMRYDSKQNVQIWGWWTM